MTLIQYLEELATERTVIVPVEELEKLVARFGDGVRRMGHWNVSSDGSLEIPVSVIREAAAQLESDALLKAVREFQDGQLTAMPSSTAAGSLIEKITDAYRLYFQDLMARYQHTDNPVETIRLRDQLVKEVFGR